MQCTRRPSERIDRIELTHRYFSRSQFAYGMIHVTLCHSRVTMMVADGLAPIWHQAISNRHGDIKTSEAIIAPQLAICQLNVLDHVRLVHYETDRISFTYTDRLLFDLFPTWLSYYRLIWQLTLVRLPFTPGSDSGRLQSNNMAAVYANLAVVT